MALIFWGGVQYGKKQIYTELNTNQKITLEAEKCLKESLRNQVDYINSVNAAHEKIVILETENENNRAKETLRQKGKERNQRIFFKTSW